MAEPLPVNLNPDPMPQPPGGEFSFMQLLPTAGVRRGDADRRVQPARASWRFHAVGVGRGWSLSGDQQSPRLDQVAPARAARNYRDDLFGGWNGSLVDFGQRILRVDQGLVPDCDLRLHLPWLAARRAAADVLYQPAVRGGRRSGAARVVERPVGRPSRLSRGATIGHGGVGNRLCRRGDTQGGLCDGAVTGAGRVDLARDGIRCVDRADLMDAPIHARLTRTAASQAGPPASELIERILRPVQGRASRTRLNGVAVARRTRENPPAVSTSHRRASPACVPRPNPTSCDSDAGTQIIVDAA